MCIFNYDSSLYGMEYTSFSILNNPFQLSLAGNFIDLTTTNAVKFIIELGFSENDFCAKEQFEQWLNNEKKVATTMS